MPTLTPPNPQKMGATGEEPGRRYEFLRDFSPFISSTLPPVPAQYLRNGLSVWQTVLCLSAGY